MPWRKYISAPYLKWPFWILVTYLWVKIFFSASQNGTILWRLLAGETGELAWRLLILTLFLGLLRKLFPSCATLVRVLPLRKYSGVFAFLIAGSHGLAHLIRNGIYRDWGAIFSYTLSFNSTLTLGTLSFLLMLPLFVTSTEWAVQKMGAKSWFWLQKLAHPAFILAGLHIVWAGRGGLNIKPMIWLGLYALGYGVLWIKRGIKKRREFESEE